MFFVHRKKFSLNSQKTCLCGTTKNTVELFCVDAKSSNPRSWKGRSTGLSIRQPTSQGVCHHLGTSDMSDWNTSSR